MEIDTEIKFSAFIKVGLRLISGQTNSSGLILMSYQISVLVIGLLK